jgi:hypothetical protein
METVVRARRQFAYAMPRGSGKTSLAEAAVLWATLYGFRQFPLVIGSDQGSRWRSSRSSRRSWSATTSCSRTSPKSATRSALEGIAHRCNGQLFDGERRTWHWTATASSCRRCPTALASGCIIGVAGITGRIRGMKFKRPDGKSVRPDLALLDDPQTDESARSPSQCVTRKKLVNGAVLGLAGPGKKIAALMPCTVIAHGDMADELLTGRRTRSGAASAPRW